MRDISFTTTILQGLDGGLVLMPNSSIISSKVVNYSRGGLLEIQVSLSVPAETDLALVREIALAVALDDPRILPNLSPVGTGRRVFDLPTSGAPRRLPRPCALRARRPNRRGLEQQNPAKR